MPGTANWKYLIEKFTKDKCSREELDQLLELVAQEGESEELTEALRNHWMSSEGKPEHSGINWEEKLYTILQEAKSETPCYS
jgi:hypothetical protein